MEHDPAVANGLGLPTLTASSRHVVVVKVMSVLTTVVSVNGTAVVTTPVNVTDVALVASAGATDSPTARTAGSAARMMARRIESPSLVGDGPRTTTDGR